MNFETTTRFCYCPATRRNVALDQTEGQCRDQYNCTGPDRCPLEAQFGQGRFRNALEMLAAAIASSWAAPRR